MPAQEITLLWGGVGHSPSTSAEGDNPPGLCCSLAEPTFTRCLHVGDQLHRETSISPHQAQLPQQYA